MCGICGIVGNVPDKKNRIKKMIQTMRHRGPDDFGILDEKNLAIGMVRLSILDLSLLGHQPMSNYAQNIWIVYNGEMYNFQEERALLEKKKYRFKSNTDTEVVLAMYEEYGNDFLLRMRGMFALTILDQRPGTGKEKILLARDHLGIKPLLYCIKGSSLIFASELKSILASGLVKKEINPEALRLLLTFGSVTQPLSMINNVKMLMPGTRLIYQNEQSSIEKYWRFGLDRYKIRNKPYQTQVAFVREALKKSVKEQMVSDVPIGAFLSGGVDSSLLVALMSLLSGVKTKTFSVGFLPEDRTLDETDEAQKIARYLKTDHSKVIITPKDVKNNIKKIAWALDQPSVDGVNSYFVSEAAKKKVTVAISGTGGDELFAGYPWFANMVAWQRSHQDLSILDKLMAYFSGSWYADGFRKYFSHQYLIFGSDDAKEIMAEPLNSNYQPAQDLESADELPYASPIERVTALCLRGYTQNQLLRDIDATSMAHSLEVRVPFLDPNLLDLVLSLPDKVKLANSKQASSSSEDKTYRELGAKKILIDIGKNILTKNLDLQKKRGFTLPFDAWLRGSLKEVLADCLSKRTVQKRGFFDVVKTFEYYQGYLKNQGSWPRIWLLMMTELWGREVLDQ